MQKPKLPWTPARLILFILLVISAVGSLVSIGFAIFCFGSAAMSQDVASGWGYLIGFVALVYGIPFFLGLAIFHPFTSLTNQKC